MTPPPRARVSWKDGRSTIVYLTALHQMSPFLGADQIFWSYRDLDGNEVGPGRHTTARWAWDTLEHWAREHESGATPFPVPEERAGAADEMPTFYPDDDEMPTFYPKPEPESREDREERMEGM